MAIVIDNIFISFNKVEVYTDSIFGWLMTEEFLQSFILHTKAYRETSALVDLFTPDGRVRAVLRNARNKSGSIARPFIPLSVSLVGKGELKTVKQIEVSQPPLLLEKNSLFSGLYLNELIIKLLPLEDTCPLLFDFYKQTLLKLSLTKEIEPLLREFEWQLLVELGYSFSLVETGDGEAIEAESFYMFRPDYGLQKIAQLQSGTFYGRDLLGMSEADWSSKTVLSSAKRLMRQVLATYLQGKPLVSRQLFTHF